MVFLGLFAAAFYTLMLGALWPPRQSADLSEQLLGLVGKSLWLSWAIVGASFWLHLPNLFPLLVTLVIIFIPSWGLFYKTRTSLTHPYAQFLIFSSIIIVSVFLFFGAFASEYSPIFRKWDSLLSWNRWAIELASNTYKPYNLPYPVLFPGLWSLIYKAQHDTSVWIFAKLTLFVLPAILGLSVSFLLSSRLYLMSAGCAVFIAEFFFLSVPFRDTSSKAAHMLSGLMDIPVAVMMMAGGIFMLGSADRLASKDAFGARALCVLAAVFAGLAAVTKQPGIMLVPALLGLLGIGVARKQFSWRTVASAVVCALLPVAIFSSMYYTAPESPIGSLQYLINLSSQMSGNAGEVSAGWFVLDMLPPWMLVAVALLACANLVNFRSLLGWMGVLFAVLGVIGFFGFAKCCVYDERNGWWIIIMFAISALFAIAPLDRRLRERLAGRGAASVDAWLVPAAALLLLAPVAWLTSHRFPDDKARSVQEDAQWTIAGPVGQMIKSELLPLMKPGDVLVSEDQPVGLLPTMEDRFAQAGAGNFCGRLQVTEAAPRLFFLVEPGSLYYPQLASWLTADKLIAWASAPDGPFALYGPYGRLALEAKLKAEHGPCSSGPPPAR